MLRVGVRFAVLPLVIALVTGCSSGKGLHADVRDLEETLVATYLEPLNTAGIETSVVRTCRFADAVDAAWHLLIEVRVDAPEDRVADVLTHEKVVVVRGREPMIVQQIFNEPNQGWDGILEKDGDGSTLSLERSYVDHAGWKDAIGWGEVCADSPPAPSPVP
ncbi:hypothetical protein BJ973_008812 [Actinoplanes tereljensis]|uniref:Lipoprotein n=1 Tax=Paractinoplanes tereljensis TaxID=571912 RepID=A0A919NHH8_9ACTN|nr:hypothetical protein [Actinoplanes tereljensis]GIF18225.1 hypothetical protein Ate02nite_09550 [Actinoplanes tereljensis]